MFGPSLSSAVQVGLLWSWLAWAAALGNEVAAPAPDAPDAHTSGPKPATHPPAVATTNSTAKPKTAVPAEIDPALRESRSRMATPNLLAPPLQDTGALQKQLAMETLEKARQERRDKHIELAETNLVSLIESPAPEEVKRGARLELALLVQDRGELAQAQQLYAQYLKLYPDDPNEPEIILRQGLIYRQMGAPVLAISKFYGVMSTALNLKSDRVDYYERLVLQAQTEIAETYYLQGKYAEASDFFSRLLKLNDSALNDAVVRGKLVRCLARLDRPGDAVTQAERYLTRYPAAGEAPEIRYLLADSLRKLGRGHDAVEQVLILLRGEQEKSVKDPAEWGQWQRRTGNDLANQLYNQGDYLDALQIYNRLLELDDSVAWQLPVQYQLGLVYERLEQPQKALDAYNFIIATVGSISPEKATPNLTTIADLARWRSQHLQWLLKIEVSRHQLVPPLLDGTEKAVVSAVK